MADAGQEPVFLGEGLLKGGHLLGHRTAARPVIDQSPGQEAHSDPYCEKPRSRARRRRFGGYVEREADLLSDDTHGVYPAVGVLPATENGSRVAQG